MSDSDMPTGRTGGPLTVPDRPAADDLVGTLPERMRVHELARLLAVSSRDVLGALDELDAPARGAQSSIDRGVAVQVIDVLLPARGEEPDLVVPEPVEAESDVPGLGPLFSAATPMFLSPAPLARDEDEVDTEELEADDGDDQQGEDGARRRRRRGRRGRGRGRGGDDDSADEPDAGDAEAPAGEAAAPPTGGGDGEPTPGDDAEEPEDATDEDGTGSQRRRRRRRRRGSGAADEPSGDPTEDDPPNTVTHVREARGTGRDDNGDGVQGVRGSTRLEAKRQRRRDGRDAGRRRAPILTEAEFLARRESVERSMVVRQHGERIEIGVLEDGVLVEHFVTGRGSASLVGNIYLGRVQNVLPSMEAAFVDIGRGRNAVLYAGEVDWDSAGLAGKARKIEQALSTGDNVLVQVTKDPIGHKGARLTTQLSLAGRFLVYVPSGGATGISRKLPDTERKRLKDLLRQIVPDDAGVIIRTASEGVSHEALERDVRRLQAQWEVVKARSEGTAAGNKSKAPQLLYEEPDLLVKVVRDQFNEDFSRLVVSGEDAWDTIDAYVRHVAPELLGRLHRHVGTADVFTEFRIDEQLVKALDRKVWLPSGGTVVIDRTEAMTVIDVNTGKFTGSGGNLEETVTRNNLEAAEEIVRQLRLRDVGGIIVIDFIDMVLESNRDLVLRRLTECLGRDRTRHQVSEVTSLGLVQMTRKRVGAGLLEAFSAPCEHCRGRGVLVSTEPVPDRAADEPGGEAGGAGGRRGRSRSRRAPADGPAEPARPEPAAAVEAEPAAPAPAEAATEPDPAAEPVGYVSLRPAPTPAPPVEADHYEPEPAAPEPAAPQPAAPDPAAQEPAAAADGAQPGRRGRRAASRPAGPPAAPSTPDPV